MLHWKAAGSLMRVKTFYRHFGKPWPYMVSPEVLPHFDPPCQLSLRAAPNQKKNGSHQHLGSKHAKKAEWDPSNTLAWRLYRHPCGFQTRMNLEMLWHADLCPNLTPNTLATSPSTAWMSKRYQKINHMIVRMAILSCMYVCMYVCTFYIYTYNICYMFLPALLHLLSFIMHHHHHHHHHHHQYHHHLHSSYSDNKNYNTSNNEYCCRLW